ncbi:MAG TPA: hypothetical protein VEY32_01780 [Flavisolibacter sp.]|nr:hypothetical protein [Flavisolibacter sp.]
MQSISDKIIFILQHSGEEASGRLANISPTPFQFWVMPGVGWKLFYVYGWSSKATVVPGQLRFC